MTEKIIPIHKDVAYDATKKQKSFDQIVEELDLDADFAKPLYDFVLKHIDLSETDIIQKYLEM